MIRIAPIFRTALMQGKTLFFSTLAFLGSTGVSLVPETSKLNESDHNDSDEMDLYAKQWTELWNQVLMVRTYRIPVVRDVRILINKAQSFAILRIQVADIKQLSCCVQGYSIVQMLYCQRKLGDPAVTIIRCLFVDTALIPHLYISTFSFFSRLQYPQSICFKALPSFITYAVLFLKYPP